MPKMLARIVALICLLTAGPAACLPSLPALSLTASTAPSASPASSQAPAPSPRKVGVTIGQALPVAAASSATAGTIVSASANPADGAMNVHALSLSSQLITWQLTTSSTKQPLAKTWAQSTPYVAGQAVVVSASSEFCVYTASGTSSGTGTGPATLGAGISDGSATCKCYAGTRFTGGITAQNQDSASTIVVGDTDVRYVVVPPNYGSLQIQVADPTATYVSAPSGSPVLNLVGWP